ncbi:MAG: TRIC cation channel family protein [Polaribacter sp.]|jgi:uncharacterized membrane protein YeiH|nr:TRIC cation channel family protein [Polaribacter sp.]
MALVMGMISAVFGGVLRDVLTNKFPLIFEKQSMPLLVFWEEYPIYLWMHAFE